MTAGTLVPSYEGLSCYTANLAAYLAAEWDAEALLARSIRLAARLDPRTGLLAFSHHRPSLDVLPDGSRLRYAAAETPEAALPVVADELDRFGRALVVVDNGRLGWSPTRSTHSAPHWLLVDGRAGDRWHVTDRFTGLLPAGPQSPHAGWLDSTSLCAAMTLPANWAPEQVLRNTLVFGAPVAVPAGCGSLILSRAVAPPDAGTPETALSGPGGNGSEATGRAGDEGWLAGDREVLPFLAHFLAERGADTVAYLDDMWAAAGHRAFVYRWRMRHTDGPRQMLERALARWADLPRVLRLAVESAQRGRPRPRLVRAAFDELLRAEEDLA